MDTYQTASNFTIRKYVMFWYTFTIPVCISLQLLCSAPRNVLIICISSHVLSQKMVTMKLFLITPLQLTIKQQKGWIQTEGALSFECVLTYVYCIHMQTVLNVQCIIHSPRWSSWCLDVGHPTSKWSNNVYTHTVRVWGETKRKISWSLIKLNCAVKKIVQWARFFCTVFHGELIF